MARAEMISTAVGSIGEQDVRESHANSQIDAADAPRSISIASPSGVIERGREQT